MFRYNFFFVRVLVKKLGHSDVRPEKVLVYCICVLFVSSRSDRWFFLGSSMHKVAIVYVRVPWDLGLISIYRIGIRLVGSIFTD